MNEDAIKDSYGLFVTEGYNGTIEDYKELLNTNSDALNDAFELFKGQGYTDTINDFSVIMGVGKPTGVVEMDATVTPEPEPVSESMDLESEDISLEQYDAMTPAEKKKIKNYKLKQRLIRESAAKRKKEAKIFEEKEIKKEEKEIKKEFTEADRKEIAEMSFAKKIGLDLAKGSVSLGEMIASVPETVYDVFSLPQNILAKVTGIKALETSAEKFKEQLDIENPVLEYYSKEKEDIQKVQDIYNDENYEFQGIYKNFSEGNYKDGFEQLASGIAESAPVSLSMMLGGASTTPARLVASSTAAFAGPEIQEIKEIQPGVSEAEAIIKGLGSAAAETVFSAIGTGTIGRVYKDILTREGKEQGLKTFRNGLIEMYRGALTKYGAPAGALGEGIEEVATAITQNMIKGRPAFENVTDAFIQGGAGGFVYTSPMNTMKVAKNVNSSITNYKINKELKNSEYSNIVEAFDPTNKISEAEIKISQIPGSVEALDNKINLEVENNIIPKQTGDEIKLNFRETQGVVNSLKPLGLDEAFSPEIVDLVKRQRKLQQTIKEVDNPSLTESESESLKNVNEELKSLVVKAKESKITKGAKAVAEAVGFEVNEFDTSAELEAEIENINKEIKDGSDIDVKEAAGQLGFILQYPDGKQRVLLNKEQALKENVVSTAAHEVLHGVLFNTVKNQGVGETLGKSLIDELNKIDADQIKNSDFKNRLNQYKESGINEDQTFEEALTLFSESLINGDLVYEENLFTKIGDFIRRTLAPVVKVKFNKGRDVYNFIRDYNRTIETGKGLKAVEKAAKGIAGKLTESQELNEFKSIVLKDSKSRKGVESSDKVQEIYDTKGTSEEAIFEIIEEFKPITAKIVATKRDAEGFETFKDQLQGAIEFDLVNQKTGKDRSLRGLILDYDPSKGVPLAAYINRFLPDRAIEAVRQILPEYYSDDIETARGVVSTEDSVSIEEAVDESIKPTEEQKSKLRRQIKLPDEQVEKVREAVRKTFGTRLPPLQSPEFKKALRKAFDTELFKELKTNVFKARKDYEFFMSQNWKALYDAIPQETLNQSFAPFREAVLDETGKQKREKTPEGERIFRKKNITKEEFLDYFFNPNVGVSTRGTRKDAIVRMLAQELGFDATMETIQEPKVAEKIEFLDKEKTVPKVAEKIGKDPTVKFSITTENLAKKILKDQFNFTDQKVNDTWYNLSDKNTANKYIDFIKDVLIPAFSDYPGLLNRSQVINRKIPGDRDKKGQKVGKVEGILMKALSKSKAPELSERSKNFEYAKHRWKNSDVDLTADAKVYYNQRNIKNFDLFWDKIFDIVAKDPKYIVPILHMLEASQNEVSHIQRLGAEYLYYDKNVIEKENKLYFEHALQNTLAYERLLTSIADNVDSKDGKQKFENYKEKLKNNYKLIGISKADNAKLDKADLRFVMPSNFDINKKGSWITRYFNEKVAKIDGGINPVSLVSFINPETNNLAQDFGINKEGKKEVKIKFKKSNLNKEINNIIENKTSIAASETINDAAARIRGQKNKKFRFFIPPSADDFAGLMYYMLGKGEVGNKQMKWMQTNLFDPYAKAEAKITAERAKITRTYEAIKKQFDIIPKNLRKNIKDSDFTQEQAVRVYVWNAQETKIPGLSESEKKKLLEYVESNKDLKNFADKLIQISGGFGYAKPSDSWVVGTITTDLLESLNTTKREAYLEPWSKNIEEIFSKENLNKLESAYGREYRIALENSLQRMKSGKNKQFGPDTNTAKLMNWVNGSIGAIMFFNTRSAILQLLSTVNFINWSDNNVFAASRAFADQKQYWSDFKMLFNSDFLLNRRQGLKMNVNEADLAEEAKKNGPMGVINRILKTGFLPTQMADSFAIATGGASFYRNRVNSLIKDGVGKAAAEKQAFQDFREAAEESQQSSRPDKISQQQAGPIGRFILAFANTPSQYARIIKKAALDLKNRRGDDRANISKIVYYMTVQNLIFNALQQAMFALAFNDDDDDEKTRSKYANIANGMADSVLRGLGLYGAAFSTLKNFLLKIYKESQKKNPKYRDAAVTLLKISPPISSKISRLEQAGAILDFEKEEIKKAGLDINNPAILAAGQTISALTNLPVDRAVKKVQNINSAIGEDLQLYQRIALLGGWNKWDLGIKDKVKPKTYGPKKREVIKRKVVKRN